jgi:hypothetical protein
LGELNATLLCNHNSFVMIVNAALGGETKGAPSSAPVKDLAAGHATAEDAVAAIMRAMTF